MDTDPIDVRVLLRRTGRLVLGHERSIDLEPKDALLLAYLAIEGPTPRLRLATLIWPDVDEERARGNLRQRLLRLKSAAGFELLVGRLVAELAPRLDHDLQDSHELLEDLDPHQAGGLAEWLQAQRGRMHRARVQRLETEIARAEAAGDFAAALEGASTLLALDPLSEHAHHRLIRLHGLRGDTAAAIAAFERCRQTLERELGVAPSPMTEQLRANIDRSGPPGRDALPQVAAPITVLRPPRLIGRDVQWKAMHEAWDTGTPVVVLGEAGLGKSRLVNDFARARGSVLVAAARPGDQRTIYALATRLLRQLPRQVIADLGPDVLKELARLLPELGEAAPIGSESERTRFYNAVYAAIESHAAAVAGVVIDDLHFADDASVELMRYLAADSRVCWLLAGRPAELGSEAQSMVEALTEKARGLLLCLAPLTTGQIVEFIESLGLEGVDAVAMAPALARHTGGNPLFALETIKAWLAQRDGRAGGGLPAVSSVAELIERRLARLSPDAVRLARCAAVAGQDFSAELAARVLGARTLDLADAWAELEAAQVFRDGVFAHDLIHEAALASVPPEIARQLHRDLAQLLGARHTAPGREAAHWLAAGDPERALPALLQAAELSRLALRARECREFLMQAADIAEGVDRPDLAFEALKRSIGETVIADRTLLDDATLDRLAANARSQREQVEALAVRAEVLAHQGRHAESVDIAIRATTQARAAGADDLAVDTLLTAAAVLSVEGDSERAVRLLRPVLPWILQSGTDEQQLEYFGYFAFCLDNSDQQAEAQEFHRRALAIALRLNRLDEAIIVHCNLGVSYQDTGQMAEVLKCVDEAVRLSVAYDEARGPLFTARKFQCVALRDLRRYDEALRAGDAALDDVQHNVAASASLHADLACLWVHLGQYARAERALGAVASRDRLPSWIQARLLQMLARSRWAQGRRAEATRMWQQAAEAATSSGRTVLSSMICLDLHLTLPAPEALARTEEILRSAERLGHLGTALAAHIRAAGFALQSDDMPAALQHAQALVDAPPGIEPNDMYRGEAWLALALVDLKAGHQDRLNRCLRDAVDAVRGIAARNVPAEFRDSFLSRNPVNRELLTLATRLK